MKDGTAGWEENVENMDFDALNGTYSVEPDSFGKYTFKDSEFEGYNMDVEAQGYIEEYYGEARCFSSMINTPGISLLPAGLMGVAYLIFLGYLFLGISISADIFMEAIE